MSLPPSQQTPDDDAALLALLDPVRAAYRELVHQTASLPPCQRRRVRSAERASIRAGLTYVFARATQEGEAETWCCACGRPLRASNVGGQDLAHRLDYCQACADALDARRGDGRQR